jgi:hypothetical protein
MPGTCEWLMNHRYYYDWKMESDNSPSHLLVTGIPGSRKSSLSKRVIEDLQTLEATGAAVIYYYFTGNDDRSRSTLEMVASLTSQIITVASHSDQGKSMKHLKEVVRKNSMFPDQGRKLKTVWKLFTSLVKAYQHTVYIVVDTLDECSDGTAFSQYVMDVSTLKNVKFLITGRPLVSMFIDIPAIVKENASNGPRKKFLREIPMDIAMDVYRFLNADIERTPHLMIYKELILETISGYACEMFLYAGAFESGYGMSDYTS